MKNAIFVLKNALLLVTLTMVACGGPSEKKSTEDTSEKTEVLAGDDDKTVETEKKKRETMIIGKQIWMINNLNTNEFSNGDAIFEAKTAKEWQEKTSAGQPVCCFADFNSDNGKIYGRLYNWYAVSDARGLCPDGWRVPTDKDFQELRTFLGDDDGNKLKSDDPKFWKQLEREFINESGFGGLPGGAVTFEGVFVQIGAGGFWWTATENEQDSKRSTAYYLGIMDGQIDAIRRPYDKQLGFSVRCIKN
jgi:uncharacterized protein (TIGR02145 family)